MQTATKFKTDDILFRLEKKFAIRCSVVGVVGTLAETDADFTKDKKALALKAAIDAVEALEKLGYKEL